MKIKKIFELNSNDLDENPHEVILDKNLKSLVTWNKIDIPVLNISSEERSSIDPSLYKIQIFFKKLI